MNIGDTLRTSAEREAAPVGAVIHLVGFTIPHDTWTKRPSGDWVNGVGDERLSTSGGWVPDETSDTQSGYVVLAWPEDEGAGPEYPDVGQPVTERAELHALPVGTVLRHERTIGDPTSSIYRTKVDQSTWRRNGNDRTTNQMRINGFYIVHSLPEQEGTTMSTTTIEAPVFTVGQQINTAAERAALPIGSRMKSPTMASTWVKRDVDRWVDEATDRNPRANDQSGWYRDNSDQYYELLTLGPVSDGIVEGYQTLRALPDGTVFRNWVVDSTVDWVIRSRGAFIRRHPDGGTDIPISTFEGPANAGQLRVVTGEPVQVEPVVPEVEETITMTEHRRIVSMRVDGAIRQEAERRNEEFLSTLRERWDGNSFTEDEINEVLSDLGLGEIDARETITVSVDVSGTTELDDSDVRGVIEGDMYATIDNTVEVEWTVDGVDFEVEVREGECGCDQVDDSMVEERLRESSFTYSDIGDMSKSCENC